MRTVRLFGNAAAYGLVSLGLIGSVAGQTNQPQAITPVGTPTQPATNPGVPFSSPPIVAASAYQIIGGENAPAMPFYSNGIDEIPWFASPAVRRELNIDNTQFTQLSAAYEQAWRRYALGVREANPSLTEAQTMQYQQYLFGVFDKNLSQAVDTFVDGASRDRFDQLYLQYRGYGAFSDPIIQQQLNLSNAQVLAFYQLDQAWNDQLSQWYEDYPLHPLIVMRAFYTARSHFGEDVVSILTPIQLQQWQLMIGEPFAFGPNDYFQYSGLANPVGDVEEETE